MILPLLLALAMPFRAAPAVLPPVPAVRAGTTADEPRKTRRPRKKAAAPSRARTATLAASSSGSSGAIHWTAPRSRNDLADDLSSMLARAKSGTWGVLVVSLSNGDTLFGHAPDMQLLPASTMKLFTSSLALDRFGAQGKFETVVLRTGLLGPDGVLHGDLVLRGAGDPDARRKAADSSGEPPMDALARQVAAAGVKRVTGEVVGDASAFLDGHVPDGWRTRYLQASYAARVSALSFNENKITIVVRPGGSHADLSFQPAVSGVPVSNVVKVTPVEQRRPHRRPAGQPGTGRRQRLDRRPERPAGLSGDGRGTRALRRRRAPLGARRAGRERRRPGPHRHLAGRRGRARHATTRRRSRRSSRR